MNEPLPSDPNVNLVCVYVCMYVCIYVYMFVCHGPARYLLLMFMILTVSTLTAYAVSVAPDLAKTYAVLSMN